MRVLNVGGGTFRTLPIMFDGWEQTLLDIDPLVKPDIALDAREIEAKLNGNSYDAVYCSHNLEHYFQHDALKVMRGFHHVLTDRGFAFVRMPDMDSLFRAIQGKRLNDVYYHSVGGPITFHDVLYGWSKEIASGNDYYAHKCGFTAQSLTEMFNHCGFPHVFTNVDGAGNLSGIAYKCL